MRAFDASSIVHAWDNYPIGQFPPVWAWLEREFKRRALVISDTALEEVGHKYEECRDWLTSVPVDCIASTGDVLTMAQGYKEALGIEGEKYHPKGVDEKDLLIIASASCNACELIANEAFQPKLPPKRWRYKIPAVCQMETVDVPCIDFLGLITVSGVVFDGRKPT